MESLRQGTSPLARLEEALIAFATTRTRSQDPKAIKEAKTAFLATYGECIEAGLTEEADSIIQAAIKPDGRAE